MFTMTVNEECKVSTLHLSSPYVCVFDFDKVNQSEHRLYFVIMLVAMRKS